MDKYKKHLRVAFLSVSMMSLFGTSYANGVTFKDVPNNYWGYAKIQWAIDNKVVDGYPDGTFKPDHAVNQNEFVAMLIRSGQPDFKPTTEPSNWATPFMAYATKKGWKVTSTDRILSRGAVAEILTNATGKNYGIDDSIQYLLDVGLANGKTAKSIEGFNKNDSLTRAEAVTSIERFKQKYGQLQQSPDKEQKLDRTETQLVYKNDQYSFSLKLPKGWEGKYEVVDNSTQEGHNLNFINKTTRYGILFTISIWSKGYWNANEADIKGQIQATKLGEKGDNVYVFHTPTDVQYDPSDVNSKEDYEFMFEDVKEIKTTFEIN